MCFKGINFASASTIFLFDFGHRGIICVEHSHDHLISERIGGVMISVLSSSAVDRGFAPQSGQIKHYTIGICFISAKHAALRRKSKDWLARNHKNMSELSDMSTHGLLFQ